MRRVLFVLFFLVSGSCFAQRAEETHVVTHNRTTVICDPSAGEKSYVGWGVFPGEGFPVRKMVMSVTLGSPDSLFTAHWDYLDHINLRRRGGRNGQIVDYELGRMLTPYGSIYNKGWSWKWEVDVTDFSPFLRDSVEIEYVHSGYEPNKVGWALTIDFEITQGDPVLTYHGITPLWNSAYKYGDPDEKIEDYLLPVSFETSEGTAISRIRIQHTGHGMDQPRGCSEFCSRWRDLKMDGELIDHRNMWKDCGANPLYPQGGTWVYDRAYWCPGDLQDPDIIDIPVIPGRHHLALEMEPYQATDNIQAIENISAYMFHYSYPNKKVDVAVDKILVPNDQQQFSRLNPACFNPQFVLRNLGSENLRSVNISYGTNGFPVKTMRWKGNLKFNQTARIVIPGEIEMRDGTNSYTVSLTKPNGRKDGWQADNTLTTTFVAPGRLPTEFVLQLMTNNRPKDNKVFLIDGHLDTLLCMGPEMLEATTLYEDTISLKEGKYDLSLVDSAGDGLGFWAEPQNGDGYLRLFDMEGNLIHAFESDCGNGEKLSFFASSAFVLDSIRMQHAFSLWPRVVVSQTELNVLSNSAGNMLVQITVDGTVWQNHEYKNVKNGTFSYDLSHMPDGRIIVEVFIDGVSKFKRRIHKSEKLI